MKGNFADTQSYRILGKQRLKLTFSTNFKV
jgi:hypothetical protein